MSWGVAEGKNGEKSAATRMMAQHDSENCWILKALQTFENIVYESSIVLFDSCDLSVSHFIFVHRTILIVGWWKQWKCKQTNKKVLLTPSTEFRARFQTSFRQFHLVKGHKCWMQPKTWTMSYVNCSPHFSLWTRFSFFRLSHSTTRDFAKIVRRLILTFIMKFYVCCAMSSYHLIIVSCYWGFLLYMYFVVSKEWAMMMEVLCKGEIAWMPESFGK